MAWSWPNPFRRDRLKIRYDAVREERRVGRYVGGQEYAPAVFERATVRKHYPASIALVREHTFKKRCRGIGRGTISSFCTVVGTM